MKSNTEVKIERVDATIVVEPKVQYKGTGRDLEIKYTITGRPYFIFRKRREYLDEYMRCEGEMDAYKCTSNFGGISIKIDDRGESVKAYWNY
jgi:hypothetical protein